jgi:hypothetical protein
MRAADYLGRVKQRVVLAFDHLRASPPFALAAFAWVGTALAMVLRVPLGTCGTDEAFYSAMPYGFVLGNKPYVDELAFHQNAGVLMMPLYRVYMWLRGSDAIMLYNRWLYLVYLGFCSVLTFRTVEKLADELVACWCAALVLSFCSFNLLALSYNTLGALGFLCGLLWSTLALFEKPGQNLFLAIVAFATAVFSYPTLLVAVAVHTPLTLWRLHARSPRAVFRRGLLGVVLASILAMAAALSFLLWVTPAGIERALEFSRSMGYAKKSALAKLDVYHDPIWAQHWYLLAYSLLLILFPLVLARFKGRATITLLCIVVPALMATVYWLSRGTYSATNVSMFLSVLPLLAPACLWHVRSFRERRLLLAQLWLPGALSMLVFTYTSANDALSAHLGVLPCLIAGVVLLWALLRELASEARAESTSYAWLLIGFCATGVVIQLHSLYEYAYDKEPQRALHTTVVRNGPQRGALATPTQAKLLEAVDRDLKSIEQPGKTLVVFDDFGTGYLSTRMRPRTFTHWVVWGAFEPSYARQLMQTHYGDPSAQPDFALLVYGGLAQRHVWRWFEKNYRVIIDRPELGYKIEQRIGSR